MPGHWVCQSTVKRGTPADEAGALGGGSIARAVAGGLSVFGAAARHGRILSAAGGERAKGLAGAHGLHQLLQRTPPLHRPCTLRETCTTAHHGCQSGDWQTKVQEKECSCVFHVY